MNICGCLVHVVPDRMRSACETIAATDGAEVHAEGEDGRLVVVVEDIKTRRASETIMDLHQIPGVISLTLTYHHFEEARDARRSRHPQAPKQTGGQPHDNI